MKRAVFVKHIDNFRGNAALYRLTKPLEGHEFVIVSAVTVPCSGPETYIFPGTPMGDIADWGELDGSRKGTLSHEVALRSAGYVLKSA